MREWRCITAPRRPFPDQLVLTQPWSVTSSEEARGFPDRVVHYQFRHDQARRTLRGIDEQVGKAQRAVDGHAPVQRNRFIKLTGAIKSIRYPRTADASHPSNPPPSNGIDQTGVLGERGETNSDTVIEGPHSRGLARHWTLHGGGPILVQ